MARKPNLLFIFTDEQRFDTMACYGNQQIHTPNLNALAEESFVFENPYVTQPVCTPSRSSIMTGLYPHTNGCTANNVPLGPETRTIAEMVSDDYLCAYYGKWHLGDEIIAQHGFGDWVSIEDLYRTWYTKEAYLSRLSDYHHFLVAKGFEPDMERRGAMIFNRWTVAALPEEYTKASFLGREVACFIRENRERPFMLYVNFLEPHSPKTGPFDHQYAPDELLTGPHFLQRPPQNASLLHRLMADYYAHCQFEGHDLKTEAGGRRIRARYWGLVTLVDRAVGVILSALAECGLANDTIVVFTSDHGDMMGDHGILYKTVFYEPSVRVALLMRVPWFGREQRIIPGRISQVDLVPTLLELMGEPVPDELQGTSRVPVLEGESTLAGNDVFIQWTGVGHPTSGFSMDLSEREMETILQAPWRTIVSAEGWKLNLSPVDQCELYDLNADPYEQHNLFDDPAQRGRIRDLADRIRRWQERTGDDVVLPVV